MKKITHEAYVNYRPLAKIIADEGWRLWLLFAVIFASYLISMPKTVMLEDDGLFIMSSYFLGIAHPPGYPIHTLSGHLFSQIPIGSVASRVHAMSGFFGALGCVLTALISIHLLRSRIAAYPAALMLAWSPVYWSQSIIAEVYTLNTFFFLLILLMLLDAVDYKAKHPNNPPGFKKKLSMKITAIACLYGLSLTNHWPLMILGSSCYLIIAWPLLKEIAARFAIVIIAITVGLIPYLWMYLYTPPPPGYTLMGPINNLNDLWFYISRQGYGGVDNSITAGITDKISFAVFFFNEVAMQFFPFGSLFVAIGFIAQWKSIGNRVSLALTFGFITTSILLIGLLNFDFDELHRAFLSAYLLPAYAITAIWCAQGIKFTLTKAIHLTPRLTHPGILYPILLSSITIIITTNLDRNFRHDDTWSERYANTLFSSLEKDSILFTDTDSTVGVIAYFHHIENLRPDITLMNSNGQLYNNRIVPAKRLSSGAREVAIHEFLRNSKKNIEFTSEPDLGYGERYNGLTYKVSFDIDRGQREFSANNASIIQYLVDLANAPNPVTSWKSLRHKEILYNAIPVFIDLHIKKLIPPELSKSYIDLVTQELEGKLMLTYTLFWYNLPNAFGGIDSILEEASTQLSNANKKDASRYFALLGKRKLMQNKTNEAKNDFLQAIDIWPHPVRNIAFGELQKIYASQGLETDFHD